MAQSGRVVLVYANVGTVASPQYLAVAKQQGFDITRARNTTSVGHKDSADEEVIAGANQESWQFSGLKVPSDLALTTLRTAYRSGSEVLLRWDENGVFKEEMPAQITNFDESHPHDGVSTYSITAAPTGPISEI